MAAKKQGRTREHGGAEGEHKGAEREHGGAHRRNGLQWGSKAAAPWSATGYVLGQVRGNSIYILYTPRT